MSETIMPAAEATSTSEVEFTSYEFAFHVLPTVAEGEVPGVVDSLKALITKAGGEIFDEEEAQRFDLAVVHTSDGYVFVSQHQLLLN